MWRIALPTVALVFGVSVRGATLDGNFSESVYATVGSQVTGIAWAPDGSNRLFVTRKGGVVQILKDGAPLATPFATVSPVFTTSECGLIGIAFDPDFLGNGYLYLFVTVSSTEQQIIRYTAVGDVGTNKTVILAGLPTRGLNHDGGAVGIGPDGKLYWGIGDLGNLTGVNADLTSLAAKIGRANRDGSVPADNPYVDGPGGNNDYIWARGFRNPYTFTFQPATGALWVSCVGTAYEQVFVVSAADHAGWSAYENNQPEGFLPPKIKYRTNGTDTRNLLAGAGAVRVANTVTFTTTAAHGFRSGERITIAGVSDASFNSTVYVAATPTPTNFTAAQSGPDAVSGGGTATTLNQGGAITGGCFYESSAVPPAYRGNYFYGDFNSGRIMRAQLGASNEVLRVDYFVTGNVNHIDMEVGPDGALYYAGFGGTIYRLVWTNYIAQQLVVTPTVVRMQEGGQAALTVRLAMPPPGDLTVTVNRTSGDPDIQVADGNSLVFTPANWAVPRVVRLRAAFDGDSAHDVATLTVAAPGGLAETVTVDALDVTAEPFALAVVGRNPLHLRLEGAPGRTYVLEATTNLPAPWIPLSTNTLSGSSTNFTDPDAALWPARFYRARLLP